MEKSIETELDELKVQILHHAYTSEAIWIRDRRKREHEFFSWVNSVLIAIIAALVAVSPAGKGILGVNDKIAISLAILLLTIASYEWQRRSRLEVIRGAAILSGIIDRLHLREPGYFGGEDAVFPPVPQNANHISFRGKVGLTLYNGATLLMATLTLAVIWTR